MPLYYCLTLFSAYFPLCWIPRKWRRVVSQFLAPHVCLLVGIRGFPERMCVVGTKRAISGTQGLSPKGIAKPSSNQVLENSKAVLWLMCGCWQRAQKMSTPVSSFRMFTVWESFPTQSHYWDQLKQLSCWIEYNKPAFFIQMFEINAHGTGVLLVLLH